jgi:Protein of unknown function (DUF5132)
MPFALAPILVGIALAPVVKRLAKPVVRGAMKTSVGLALEAKKAAHEVGEEFADLSAEIVAEMTTKSDRVPIEKKAEIKTGRVTKAAPAK